MIPYSPGYAVNQNYGKLQKCPFCTAEDVTRETKNQLTCGGISCQDLLRAQTSNRCKRERRKRTARIRAAKEFGV